MTQPFLRSATPYLEGALSGFLRSTYPYVATAHDLKIIEIQPQLEKGLIWNRAIEGLISIPQIFAIQQEAIRQLPAHQKPLHWIGYGVMALSGFKALTHVIEYSVRTLKQKELEDRNPVNGVLHEISRQLVRVTNIFNFAVSIYTLFKNRSDRNMSAFAFTLLDLFCFYDYFCSDERTVRSGHIPRLLNNNARAIMRLTSPILKLSVFLLTQNKVMRVGLSVWAALDIYRLINPARVNPDREPPRQRTRRKP